MTYLADTRASIARGMRGGSAMGATAAEAVTDPVGKLTAAVNRFAGGNTPSQYRLVEKPYPRDTKLTYPVALSAVAILQHRGVVSALQYGDQASADLVSIGQALKDPVPYVSANMSKVTDTINAFADSVGLPVFTGWTERRIFGVPASALALGAAGAVALVFVLKGKKR